MFLPSVALKPGQMPRGGRAGATPMGRDPSPSALTSPSPRGAPAGSHWPPRAPVLSCTRLPRPPRPRFHCPLAPRCQSCQPKPSRRSCLLPPPPPRWMCSRTCTEGGCSVTMWHLAGPLQAPLLCSQPGGMPGLAQGWQEPPDTYSPFSTPTNCRLFLLPSASLRGGPSRFFMMDLRAPGGRETVSGAREQEPPHRASQTHQTPEGHGQRTALALQALSPTGPPSPFLLPHPDPGVTLSTDSPATGLGAAPPSRTGDGSWSLCVNSGAAAAGPGLPWHVPTVAPVP